MALGFEVAGIILATLPLLINAIEHRDIGSEPLNALFLNNERRKNMQRNMEENILIFRHCCEKMLSMAEIENIADLVAEHIEVKAWENPTLGLRLEAAFGEHDFTIIKSRLVEIHGLVKKLRKAIEASRIVQAIRSIAQVRNMELLNKAIKALRTILEGESLSVAIGTAGTAWQDEIDEMKATRTHLLNIHSFMDAIWGCSCKRDHVINFQYRPVQDDHLMIILAASSSLPKTKSTKTLWLLNPLQISLYKQTQSKAPTKVTDNLCKSLKDRMKVSGLSEPATSQSLVYSIQASEQIPHPKALVPLSNLLQGGLASTKSLWMEHGHKDLAKTPKDRIAIGAKLLFAVLQQHTVPWLQPSWTIKEVFLRSGNNCSLQPYFEAPFGTENLSTSGGPNEAKFKPFFSRNATLYSLGVALVEIAMNDTIDNLITEEDRATTQDPAMIRAIAALRLSEELADYLIPPEYRDATRYCLKGEFGMEIRGKELSDDDLFSTVYRKAAKPLMELVSRNIY